MESQNICQLTQGPKPGGLHLHFSQNIREPAAELKEPSPLAPAVIRAPLDISQNWRTPPPPPRPINYAQKRVHLSYVVPPRSDQCRKQTLAMVATTKPAVLHTQWLLFSVIMRLLTVHLAQAKSMHADRGDGVGVGGGGGFSSHDGRKSPSLEHSGTPYMRIENFRRQRPRRREAARKRRGRR